MNRLMWFLSITLALAAAPAFGRSVPRQNVNPDANLPDALKDVGIVQRLNHQIPLDVQLTDSNGVRRSVGELIGERPAVLAFVFYECPMLCTLELNGLLRALRAMPLTAGKEFDVLTVSFEPKDTPELAAAKKAEYLEKYRRPEGRDGWHFLVGDEAEVKRLADAAGFRYRMDPDSGQWAHASGIMVVTPGGKLSRYLYGIEYSARDLRLGLVEAGRGKIGSLVDQVLLFCYHYDPATGKYGLLIMNLVRAGGLATVLAICAFWVVMHRRQKSGKKTHVDRLPVIS